MELEEKPKDEFLTVHELARVLKVPASWVYSRTRETGPGSMPRVKIGKYVRFIKREVIDWARNRTEPEGEE